MEVTEVTDARAWDAALLTFAQPHILQSWAWGALKAQTGWRAIRLLWRDHDGAPRAAATLLVRRLAATLPVAVAYVPKGPLLDWSDDALIEAVLGRLEAEARRRSAIFVKIDPDVRADAPAAAAVTAALRRRGWRPSAEQIQYRNTLITDLTPDEDALLAAMKPKWRYNIRLAERRGVTVRSGGMADLPAFYTMYAETGVRDGFLVRPYGYYRTIWEHFLAHGLGHLLLAEVENEPVAGLFLFRFGPTAWYFYGASTGRSRELMPNHALQWAALRWAKAAGCTRYDWWGAPDVLDESDPMWGVYRFKQGFGGAFTSWIGAWDYPTTRLAYWGYAVAMPQLLALMRRRHRIAANPLPA
ncbi:MAG: peptidoglycan bridge formation glycyltransferase FemA/FemB family protein [Anaerolineae bacterium]